MGGPTGPPPETAAPRSRNWRKSSHSGDQGGECVEVAETTSAVSVRDQDPGGTDPHRRPRCLLHLRQPRRLLHLRQLDVYRR
ncbi:DUF397 domain-containing protein [Streptomyces canus]|uniref:DUF397 domain-containing protein n=1 Tax=Streptomyces canus TaxID=58343 RepID=UPI003720700F